MQLLNKITMELDGDEVVVSKFIDLKLYSLRVKVSTVKMVFIFAKAFESYDDDAFKAEYAAYKKLS